VIVEQVTGPATYHGEGPVWWESWGGLRWVDTYAGDILRLGASGVVERWHVADMVTSIRPTAAGGVIMSSERGILLADEPDGAVRELATPVSDPGQRLNDGACDPDGAFWCGTIDQSGKAGGALYRVGQDGLVTTAIREVSISNGIAWSPDGGSMYYVDSASGRIDVFDFTPGGDGSIRNGRPFATVTVEGATPDGIAVDEEGGVWVALWNGFGVDHYDAEGRLVDRIQLPVRKVSACTFGGDDLDELYITTSREDEPDAHPAAGSVFRARPGVRGLPTATFGGV